jgi:hypothetical protein
MKLPPDATATASEVLTWSPTDTRLHGLLLPSLKPFLVAIPKRVGVKSNSIHGSTDFALTSKHLYAESPDGTVWRAKIPRP